MKDYHFEKDDREFDETIRLNDINEELKKLEQDGKSDELGDKNDFLNAFQSERFDGQRQESPAEPKKNLPSHNLKPSPNGDEPFFNKKTMGIVALAAVVVAIVCFVLVRGMFGGGELMPGGSESQSPMLIQGVLDGGEVVVYDIEQNANKSITLTTDTTVTDDKGQVITETNLAIGDLVLVGLDKTGKNALTIDYGGKLKQAEATGLTVDIAARILSNEDKSYSYGQRAMFLYNEEEINPRDLEPCDTLLLKGYEDEIWSVEVLEYHGYILIENKDSIENGKFKLDDEEEISLEDVERLAVTEGTHTVVVTGDNIEKREDRIMVATGEEYVYDLSKAQEKVGVVIINANVADYKLYINGTLVDSSAPAVLPLGEYDLVILKNGYLEWNQHISLKSDTLTVDANLQKELQYGTLSISSNVEGATVYIDDKAMGTTPINLELPYGGYQLLVSKSGYESYSSPIMISSSSMHLKAELE